MGFWVVPHLPTPFSILSPTCFEPRLTPPPDPLCKSTKAEANAIFPTTVTCDDL